MVSVYTFLPISCPLEETISYVQLSLGYLLVMLLFQLSQLMKMRPGGMDPSRGGRHKKKSPKMRHKKLSTHRGHSPTPEPLPPSQEIHHDGATPVQTLGPADEGGNPPATINNREPTEEACDDGAIPQQGVIPPKETETGLESTVNSPELQVNPPELAVTSPEQLLEECPTIATTPVSSSRTVVDIQNSFQEASDLEHNQEVSPDCTTDSSKHHLQVSDP